MSKIKIVFYLVLIFIGYKGFVAFKNFEIGVGDRVALQILREKMKSLV
jgi:hypothetical protein